MSNTLFDLAGRVALVTGGSKGLGKAMARGFVEAGANVVIASRHEDELQAAAAEIGQGRSSARVVPIAADLTRREDAQRLAKSALDAFGRVDILVNNAGGNKPQAIDKITDETWDYFLELNLSSAMALSRALVPQMIERHWGRIIHISSILGFTSIPERGIYSATKSALQGLARASALDLGKHGITVNCLAPGPFLTELTLANFTEESRQKFADRTALGRWGDPNELIGPALLLASQAGSYITGAVLVVDGGTIVKTM